jgi:predicted ATPase
MSPVIIVPEPYSSTVRSSERQVTGTVAPIGRKSEIAKIEGFLDHLPDGSRTVLLEGEVGIGKTTLIDWGRDAAQGRGLSVLAARPVEAEFPLEFAGLADLLEGVPGVLIDTLPAPQRQAVRVAVLRDELPESPLDPRTIATAVLTMIRALATTAPVVLLVDDLPWLDVPSAKVLSFVLRRAGAAPVGLLGAVRTDWSGERPPILALDHVDPDRIETVCVGPISADAMRALMAARTGIAPGPSQLLPLHRASGGNPLFAIVNVDPKRQRAPVENGSTLVENLL